MNGTDLLDHPIISARYFFPRTDAPERPFWVDVDGARLACAYHEVDAEAPTLVHFHGNGETVFDYLDGFPEIIGRLGGNCFLAEYRGYGGSSGKPQLGKMLADVTPTIQAIPGPAKRHVLFGRSVGSLFAIKALEHFPNVAGLILESAIADPLERLLLRMRPEELGVSAATLEAVIRQAINIPVLLAQFKKPVLVLHTRHDGLVDASHAERLAAWCGGRAKLTIFPQGNHNDIMYVNSQRYFGLVKEFLSSLQVN